MHSSWTKWNQLFLWLHWVPELGALLNLILYAWNLTFLLFVCNWMQLCLKIWQSKILSVLYMLYLWKTEINLFVLLFHYFPWFCSLLAVGREQGGAVFNGTMSIFSTHATTGLHGFQIMNAGECYVLTRTVIDS